jgi:hypothetical protein
MSLRLRLISLVAMVLLVTVVFGSAVACLSASRSVRTEMPSALVVARQSIENANGGNPHPSRPFAAVVAKGSFGAWAGTATDWSERPL